MNSTHLASTPTTTIPEIEEFDQIRERLLSHLDGIVPRFEIELHVPKIRRIQELKVAQNAIILGHNYQVPEIFHGIADITGDSLALAREAARAETERIVFCGVHFMAETAKILNPEKRVLLSNLEAGCSLAESITAEDVRQLKAQYPGVPVVNYVNTSAAVKAESDYCCTSSNALQVVEAIDSDRILFLPDEYLTRNTQALTKKELIPWPGRCMVHEVFQASTLEAHRQQFPGIEILAHPECSPEVVAEADFTGSTSAMIDRVADSSADRVMLVTECGMSDNIRNRFPEKEFTTPCTVCPHMKRIDLDNIIEALEKDQYPIEVNPEIAQRARLALERMLEIG
ncbi:MAG: quinolinate synthase NadA [Planctomycetota bacterium]|jgi:quinolinate synthase|nr:quinolinate synthase NadA [Planctomycetota bacterium]